jgi:hypothetical protein
MISRITVWVGVAVLLSHSLCAQEADISKLLDRYVGLDGPLPRNESIVLELLESPELLESELLDRIEEERPMPELYFYGVLANRTMNEDLKYQVWRAAATGSLQPDAEAWSSAESVIAFLPLARAEDAELLEKLSSRDFPLAPRLPKSLKQRIDSLDNGSDAGIASPAQDERSSNGDGVRKIESESSQAAEKSNLTDTESPTLPKWALALIAVAALGILALLIRAFLSRWGRRWGRS